MVGLFIGLMVPLVVDQVARFVDNLPGYVDRLAEFADRFGIDFSSERLAEALTNFQDDLASFAADIAGGIFGVGTALLGTVMQILTVALFTFYMTADGPRLRRAVLSMLPAAHEREVLWVIDVAIDRTGGYFYSRALLAGISTSVAWAAFTIIGIPYPLALALWMGLVSQFVPVLGTYIGGILPLVVALIESPRRAWRSSATCWSTRGSRTTCWLPDHRPDHGTAPGSGLRGRLRRRQPAGRARGADGPAGGGHHPGDDRRVHAPARGGRSPLTVDPKAAWVEAAEAVESAATSEAAPDEPAPAGEAGAEGGDGGG